MRGTPRCSPPSSPRSGSATRFLHHMGRGPDDHGGRRPSSSYSLCCLLLLPRDPGKAADIVSEGKVRRGLFRYSPRELAGIALGRLGAALPFRRLRGLLALRPLWGFTASFRGRRRLLFWMLESTLRRILTLRGLEVSAVPASGEAAAGMAGVLLDRAAGF